MPSTAQDVLHVLSEHGTLHRIRRVEDAPTTGHHVYVVFNGANVLQIGHGSGRRMESCMRGALAKRHNKAFICAFGETVLGGRNEYAFIDVQGDEHAAGRQEAARIEASVHRRFGIQTNHHAACLIAGLTDDGPVSVQQVNRWLWNRVVELDSYRNLSPGRKAMAEELMDLVTWGTLRERAPGRNRLTRQGDLLEGHMLAIMGKAHLIHVFQELTSDYLRYGRHRLSDEEFSLREQGYRYAPRGRPFEIALDRGERLQPALTAGGGRRTVVTAAAAPVPARAEAADARRIAVATPAPGPAAAARVHVLRRKTRLLFERHELDRLPRDAWIEFEIYNRGNKSDPRHIDLVFRCRVRDVAGFFDMDTDVDWQRNGRHSWSRFPDWARRYVARGTIGA